MKRTNIYLDEEQSRALDAVARAEGVSRASVIRRMLDESLSSRSADLAEDLQVLDQSFGVLGAREGTLKRGHDARARHLERLAER